LKPPLLVAIGGGVLIAAVVLLAVAGAMGLLPPEACQIYETGTTYSIISYTVEAEGPPEDILPPELLAGAGKLVSKAYPGYNVTCVAARYERDYGYLMLFVVYNGTRDVLIQVNAPNGDAPYILGRVEPVLNATELVLNTTIPAGDGTHWVVACICSYAIPLYYEPPAMGISGYWWSLKYKVIWYAELGGVIWMLNATMKVWYYYGYKFTCVLDRSYASILTYCGWYVAHFDSDAFKWGGRNGAECAVCWATGQFDNWFTEQSDKVWVEILFDVYENIEIHGDRW